MKSVQVRLINTDHVKHLVEIVEKVPYDVDMCSGRYVVDAKSILGIFSLDLSKPIRMDIYNDDCGELIQALQPYIV